MRGKVTDLEADKSKLIRKAAGYVESLSVETDGEKIEKVFDEQPELIDRVDQALEKAMEYLKKKRMKR